jgi:hypothetical protein
LPFISYYIYAFTLTPVSASPSAGA